MHGYFSTWLRSVNTELTQELTENRWKAVTGLVDWAVRPLRVIQLGICAISITDLPTVELEELRKEIRKGDASISPDGNDAEIQTLAASAIAQLLQNENPTADVAALCVMTGTFGGREPETSPGLRRIAQRYLASRAVTERAIELTEPEAVFSPGRQGAVSRSLREIEDAIARSAEDGSGGDLSDLAQSIRDLCEVVGTLAKRLKVLSNADLYTAATLTRSHRALAEESDILWWIFNEYSPDLKKPRSQLSAEDLVLPSARELARLITHRVPPTATIEFLRECYLSRQRRLLQPLTLTQVIDATSPEWQEVATRQTRPLWTAVVFPIHAEIESSHARLSASSDCSNQGPGEMPSGSANSPEVVGLQYLHELLLIKCLSDSGAK